MKKETPKNYNQQADKIYNIGNIQNAKFGEEKEPLPKNLTPIPAPPKYFIGRDEEMKELQDRLSKEKVLLLVSGMGGIGKTAIAQTYAEQQAPNYTHTAWLHYLTDLPQALQSSLRHLPQDWQLQEKEPPQEYAQRILHKMANLPGPNLLIIDGWDNADEINAYRDYLNLPNWTLLITTRVQDSLMEQYTIGQLPKDKAMELFLHHAPRAKGDAQVPELLELIGYHTLMIELLAKTYEANIFLDTIADMLTPLKEYDWEDTDLAINIRTHHAPDEVQVYQHLLATFKMAGLTEIEQHILLQFSVLPSVVIKAKELFEWICWKEEYRIDFINVLKSLTQKGWIEKTKTQAYQAHPIIQTALRYQLQPNADNCKGLIYSFASLLNIKAGDNPLHKAPLIVYTVAILTHIVQEHEMIAGLANNLSLVYQDLGNLSKALSYQEKAVAIGIKKYDVKSLMLAKFYNTLSGIHQDLGNLSEALTYQEKAVEIDQELLNPQDPSLATSYNNISLIYQDLGKLEKALTYQNKTLTIYKAAYDEKHPFVATSYNNLSRIYEALGDLETALTYQQMSLEIYDEIYDKQHPSFAISYNNMSTIYLNLGELRKALDYQKKSFEIRLAILNPEHPDIAQSYNNLSSIYMLLSDMKNALDYQRKAIELKENIYNSQHPELAISYMNMGGVYIYKGDLLTAKDYIDKAVAIYQYNFPDGHHYLTSTLKSQAFINQHLPTK